MRLKIFLLVVLQIMIESCSDESGNVLVVTNDSWLLNGATIASSEIRNKLDSLQGQDIWVAGCIDTEYDRYISGVDLASKAGLKVVRMSSNYEC